MTSLGEAHCYRLVDMLDLDKSGNLEFDEFYVLMCILISIKVRDQSHRWRMYSAAAVAAVVGPPREGVPVQALADMLQFDRHRRQRKHNHRRVQRIWLHIQHLGESALLSEADAALCRG